MSVEEYLMGWLSHLRKTFHLLTFFAFSVSAQSIDRTELSTISAIRNQGLQASQVMEHLTWIADVYGPRITGTPGFAAAGEWVTGRAVAWGLSDVHREYFKFGPGWSYEKSEIRMTSPSTMQIVGYPISWTPGTSGLVKADVINPLLSSEADFANWHGRLHGKIVLLQPARSVEPILLPMTQRFSQEDLRQLFQETPVGWQWLAGEARNGEKQSVVRDREDRWTGKLVTFLKREGVVAVIERGPDSTIRSAASVNEQILQKTQRIDGGTVFTPIGDIVSPQEAQEKLLPWLVIAVEQYNRMVRILQNGVPVKMEIEVGVTWYPETAEGNGFNILADIKGKDLADQVVIIGAHLDGAHTATAAVDDAAGVAMVLEAMRLLTELRVTPRRTIRMALWGGEENGLIGSGAYVKHHYGDPFKGPPYAPETARVAAYFNLDGGSGRVRGLYTRNNLASEPLLEHWIEPLKDLGVTTIARRATLSLLEGSLLVSGSDHLYFDAVGIPAFECIQDRLDYFSRTAHSNMDYVDRASKSDMIQGAVVLAVLAYEAAMSDDLVPRRGPSPPIGPQN
jgi:carboxypeptidase Q